MEKLAGDLDADQNNSSMSQQSSGGDNNIWIIIW